MPVYSLCFCRGPLPTAIGWGLLLTAQRRCLHTGYVERPVFGDGRATCPGHHTFSRTLAEPHRSAGRAQPPVSVCSEDPFRTAPIPFAWGEPGGGGPGNPGSPARHLASGMLAFALALPFQTSSRLPQACYLPSHEIFLSCRRRAL